MSDPPQKGPPRKTRRSGGAALIRALGKLELAPVRARERAKIAIVLSGGGARGAYEAGVLRYVFEELPRATGVRPRVDVVCGTSVGALHACFLAATADVADRATPLLWERWLELRAEALVVIRPLDLFRFGRSMLGGAPIPIEVDAAGGRRGGLIDASALERFVIESAPWSRIRRTIDGGVVEALAVSTTHVATGRTVVFVDQRTPLPPWSRDPHVRARAARIGPFHALASAAIPVLFPPMPLDGAFYVDGGLRQNTPLSPAIRLGADRVLVISLRRAPAEQPEIREEALPSPFFLAGKTLNALLIDRVDYDLDRLRQMNAILELGEALAGPAFAAELRARIAAHDHGATRIVRDLVVRPSRDLGELAAAYARGPAFARSTSMTARVIRRLAERDPSEDADLLSYLLFDGPFARDLLALGYEDARARRDELAAFFA